MLCDVHPVRCFGHYGCVLPPKGTRKKVEIQYPKPGPQKWTPIYDEECGHPQPGIFSLQRKFSVATKKYVASEIMELRRVLRTHLCLCEPQAYAQRLKWCEAFSAVGPKCKKSPAKISGENFDLNHGFLIKFLE